MSEFEKFEAFPKIPRLRRECVITEKLDGTNAQVAICLDGRIFAGSRNRYLTRDNDNAGFCAWVEDNADMLRDALGPGRHFGEWWGQKIGRHYGLDNRRFWLFNTDRWRDGFPAHAPHLGVVPVLANGVYSDELLEGALSTLRSSGSVAAPGWMKPEGVVVYMRASGTMHKVLLDNDELPKGLVPHGERVVGGMKF